jgi:hypothetical protein
VSEEQGRVGWCALIGPLIHPTKVLIIETLLWIDRPMSASEFEKVFGGAPNLGVTSYHLRSLASLGVLERVGKRRVRGAWEKFYFFAPPTK